MYSKKQCEVARTMTSSKAPDTQINQEALNMSDKQKKQTVDAISRLVKIHDMPIDKGWPIMKRDFDIIASEFLIDPATLFCIYMDNFK